MNEWTKYFPYETPRCQQVDAIDSALSALCNEGKKFVIIEAGTGVGKSAVGLTVSRYLTQKLPANENYESGGYFLTTQKILQEQYVNDFGSLPGMMRGIKSSTNYTCGYHKKNTCAESLRALRTAEKNSRFWKACVFNCVYRNAKEAFMKSTESVTNFPYFLAETAYSGKIVPRRVLVVDEAHNVNTELSKFIEITITERFSKLVLKLKLPKLDTQAQAFKWVKDVYAPKLFSHVKHVENMLEKYVKLKDKLQEFVGLAKQFDMLDKHACKLRRFMEIYHKENWAMNLIPAYERAGRKIEFKPIDVAPFANNMLFKYGEKVIMMSATILNKRAFCQMLNIPEDQTEFISIPSPFPTKNRPVIYAGVGGMSSQKIDQTLPKLAEAVSEILKNHPKGKGIIHCHTFKIANFLKKNIRSRRLLIHNSSNREEILRKHLNSDKPTVLLSPSMTEGIDLKDDLSRFQIICKIPYPYLGDKLVRKRMNKWRWWYPLQTAKTIVQATGRSVRSIDDHAVTYILDSDWEMFFMKNRKLFPSSFTDCLM